MIDWTREEHPIHAARDALVPPHIQPTAPGDPQTNPPADPKGVQILLEREWTPEAELAAVADSAQRWARDQAARPEAERATCAILAPRNQRGFEMIAALEARQVPHVEVLRSTSITRQTAGALGNLLRCLADPTSARKLSVGLLVWRRRDLDEPGGRTAVEAAARRLRGCPAVEAYLWPRADHDWLASLDGGEQAEDVELLAAFRPLAQRWHLAAGLPIDQLVLTLAGDLFREPSELALAHKLALLLRDVAQAHPTYRLPELVEELGAIARNERRFLGFAAEETGFEPPRGKVTVTTMHKAKGLEWDRVYLLSITAQDFPSGLDTDSYVAEPWFVRDNLNLEAEALAQLDALHSGRSPATMASLTETEGVATRQARLDYVRERLRLLYVGITRARRELYITWNTGQREAVKMEPAVAVQALHAFWSRSPARQAEPDA